MKEKLTEKEKELIGIILDYGKESLLMQERIQKALNGESANFADLVSSYRVYDALDIAHTGDYKTELTMGYTYGDFGLDEAFEFIELAMNDDAEGARKWWRRYE